ncbi:MAG: hypothetical protein E7428_08475 [Ruminococcaceae bacterium]|nr:hypothetical protein [Oscillospiraceae bacterium]
MSQVVSLGELIVDMLSSTQDASIAESASFIPAPGGAPANVAVGCVRQGVSATYIGKVGEDAFGHFMYETMASQGVDASGIAFDPDARTTLNFNARRADGVRECLFYRHPGADMRLSAEDIRPELFQGAEVLHFGSVTLSSKNGCEATDRAIALARENGMWVSYDPNLRLGLWTAPEAEIRETILSYFPKADFVKISDDESEFILGTGVPCEIAEKLFAMGVKLVVVTMGAKGCYWTDGKASGSFDAMKGIEAIDTTGAGDSFVASMVSHLVWRKTEGLPLVADQAYADACDFANRAGALATTKIGAIPALPTREEVLATY